MNQHQTHRNSAIQPAYPIPEPVATLWQCLALEPNTLDAEQQAWLQEAVTHTSSGLNPHHERLEFLGDAVLRLTASEFIAVAYQRCPWASAPASGPSW